MERNFDNRDFEQYLKRNADQYKMYPSEKVWDEIHRSLHPRRRWAGITALLLLITGAIVTTVMVLGPSSKNDIAVQQQPENNLIAVKKTESPSPSEKKNTPSLLQTTITQRPIAANRIPSIIPDAVTSEQGDVTTEEIAINQPAIVPQVIPEMNKTELQQVTNNIASKPDVIVKNYIPQPVVESLPAVTNKPVIHESATTVTVANDIKQNTVSLLSLSSNKQPALSKKKEAGKKKISFQVYFTPGISYRRLTENKEAILAAAGGPTIPTNIALQDVKNVVKHKPDAGFELGLAAKYPLSKRIAVKTGLQFNVNKYDIRAFSYSGEPATIAIQGNSQQTVTRTSYYRNSSGYRPNWLTNVYFSLSLPVGAEIKVLNSKKVDLGFGITGQPTYLLDNRAYMISTDYKNYIKVPDLMRRWNINAGAEIIVGIKSKRTTWQIGPQVRYQTLSSFKDKYPVKENLFNFGLKAGIMLNQ